MEWRQREEANRNMGQGVVRLYKIMVLYVMLFASIFILFYNYITTFLLYTTSPFNNFFVLGESSNISLFPTAPRAYLSFPSPISNPSHFSMQVSTRPPSSRRTSHSEMRGRAPLPVASGAPQNPQNPQNGHSRNPSALDVARSPPNQSNKSKS